MSTEPAADFECWLASSRTPPDKRSPDELCEGISAALASRDIEAVPALLARLAFADPRKAQAVLDMIQAVSDGDDRRAVLIAALGGAG